MSVQAVEWPPLDFQPAFIVGAPRSGTTWLQHMLGSHDQVCSPQETGLFSSYLGGWRRRWEADKRASSQPGSRVKGLATVLTDDQFSALVRLVAGSVYETARRSKPSATVVLDKDPTNARKVVAISAAFPEARFIHIIRDGRDVAASMLAAHSTWGRLWAPNSIESAAREWKDHVCAARAAASSVDHYCEIRYEDLLADTPAVIATAFDFLGIDVSDADCRRTAHEFSFQAMRDGTKESGGIVMAGEFAGHGITEPEGFYRRGVQGSWKPDWSPCEQSDFDSVAGELLVELGYETNRRWWPRTNQAIVRRRLRSIEGAARRQARSKFASWLARHPGLAPPSG